MQQQQVTRGRMFDAAVINGSQLGPVAVWIKRLFAFGLIVLSLYGTQVQALEFSPTEAGRAWLVAIAYQVVFSLAQFALRQQWQSVWYVSALAGSVVPSVLTYGPLVVPGLARSLTNDLGADLAGPLAWGIVGLVMTLVDVIPEQILVRR